MSFTEICWLIVKICLGITAFVGVLGLVAKKIASRRERKIELEDKTE